MKLIISPQPHYFAMLLSLTNILFFTKKISKNITTNSYINQDKSTRHKKTLLMFTLYLTLLFFILYSFSSSFIGYRKNQIIYRSIQSNDYYDILKYIEIIYETLLKSSLFLTLVIFIPLVFTKNNIDLIINFILIYSGIRIISYPLLIHILREYSYFSTFILEIFQISETLLLIFVFVKILNNKKIVEDCNLIETYEHEYIYLKIIKKCKFIIGELGLELVYRIVLVYFMINNIENINKWMNIIYIMKIGYIQMMIMSVETVIFCKEQETFDNLMNFTEVHNELKKSKV
ncbi:uncharacterized protein VNE69_04119 [Vairimorpha necatrix]|uniref:Membrane protein n=1 Tax=Vairimorpha necatrix TaxID=6039 RepID=A0AAX4JBH5_9MICR